MTAYFPQDHQGPSSRPGARYKDLGITPLVRQLDLRAEQTFGKWCGACEGIWFGHCLEVQCPVCGNRRG
ncbi:MAG: hypothetical protein ACT4QA_11290 [Panacagrimonas sp.]